MLMSVPPPVMYRADVAGASTDASSLSSSFSELEQIEERTSVILSPAPSDPASHPWAERTVFNSSPLSMMSTSSHSSFPSSPNSTNSLASTSSLSPLPPAAAFCESYALYDVYIRSYIHTVTHHYAPHMYFHVLNKYIPIECIICLCSNTYNKIYL